jgi:hypothetical protein
LSFSNASRIPIDLKLKPGALDAKCWPLCRKCKSFLAVHSIANRNPIAANGARISLPTVASSATLLSSPPHFHRKMDVLHLGSMRREERSASAQQTDADAFQAAAAGKLL